jgi:hypothetical protein
MKWVGDVACMGRREMLREFWWGNLKDLDHFEDQDMDERIILKTIFRK